MAITTVTSTRTTKGSIIAWVAVCQSDSRNESCKYQKIFPVKVFGFDTAYDKAVEAAKGHVDEE